MSSNFCSSSLFESGNNETVFTMRAIEEMIKEPNEELWQALQSHFYAWAVSGVFAWAATILELTLIFRHLRNYHKPIHQRHITRILVMVPVYSITSWLTFRYFNYVVYLEFIRGLFESMVIFEFFNLLLQYLGETPQEQMRVLKSKSVRKLPYPLMCFTFNPASPHFVNDCKIVVMQYAIVRQVTTVMGIIMEAFGVYCPESLSPLHGRLYITLINIGSTAVAMYGLVLLYLTIRQDISEYRPITKFLSVKFVLFLTFWQTLILAILSNVHLMPHSKYWHPADVTAGIQSFLICVEMFIAAMWHSRDTCFGVGDFQTIHNKHKTNILESMRDAFDPTHAFKELGRMLVHLFQRLRGRAKVRNFYTGDTELMMAMDDQTDDY